MAKKLEYQLLMEKNSIELKELPKELRQKINAVKPTIARFNASKPPSEKLKQAIIKQDLEICDTIADWIERELPEHDGNDDGVVKSEAEAEAEAKEKAEAESAAAKAELEAAAKEKSDAEAKEKAETEAAALAELKAKEDAEAAIAKEKADAEAAELAAAKAKAEADAAKKPITNFGTIEMENAIVDECKSRNGYIESGKLEKIISKSPSYPEQDVYSIKLRKVFMKSEYKLQ